MNKSGKLMLTVLGFGIVAGSLVIIPNKPLAASASAGPAVTVANVPLPVSPTGTQTVAGTVSVGNTPSVNAQQSGTWNVGINGIPSVSITGTPTVALATNSLTTANTGTTPVPVRDVDSGVRQPFAVFLDNGANSNFTVPANSALVIETISIAATGTQGSPRTASISGFLVSCGAGAGCPLP